MTLTIILVGLIVYLTVMNFVEKHKATNREKDLLTRLAAKDLQDYTLAVERLQRRGKEKTVNMNDLMDKGEDILPVN